MANRLQSVLNKKEIKQELEKNLRKDIQTYYDASKTYLVAKLHAINEKPNLGNAETMGLKNLLKYYESCEKMERYNKNFTLDSRANPNLKLQKSSMVK
ncbi:MAG: hypothetical protein KDD45_04940 [Bdellovibrionales bacterium]|nr:hypothetical protein [Bdellovibrionales bacterium]